MKKLKIDAKGEELGLDLVMSKSDLSPNPTRETDHNL